LAEALAEGAAEALPLAEGMAGGAALADGPG
jgi:hypothetical protein